MAATFSLCCSPSFHLFSINVLTGDSTNAMFIISLSVSSHFHAARVFSSDGGAADLNFMECIVPRALHSSVTSLANSSLLSLSEPSHFLFLLFHNLSDFPSLSCLCVCLLECVCGGLLFYLTRAGVYVCVVDQQTCRRGQADR